LGGFDESLHDFADWERSLKAIANRQKCWTIPEYLDCYRSTLENAPIIAQHPDQQQTINAVKSRYQTFFANPSVISLEPQSLNQKTLNYRLTLENQRTISNPGKRILLFCDALDNSESGKWNCDLVIWLDKCGYDVTIATTSASDHSCQAFFYQATPDIFHLANLFERSHWLAFVRYILTARQIDSVLISSSGLAYAFLPLLKIEFPHIALLDYIGAEQAIAPGAGTVFPHDLSQLLDYRLVTSHRQAREATNSNSALRVKVCPTQGDVEIALAETIKLHHNLEPTKIDIELEEALEWLVENLQEPVKSQQSEVIQTETPIEPTARQLLKLLLKKLIQG